MKKCTLCLEEKSLEEFSKRSGKQSHLYQSRCKKCRSSVNAKRNMERYYSEPEFKERILQYAKDNPEKIAEYRKKEYENNREDYLRRAKEWRSKNSAAKRQISRRYKAKRKSWELRGSFTQKEWDSLVIKSGGICLACEASDKPLTQDHVVPLSKNGSNTIDNIQPLCGSCNSSKATKTIDYRS